MLRHLTKESRPSVCLFIRSSIHSSGQVLLPQHLVNGLNNFDKTDREYSLAPIDDLIRFWFWRSKVKVIAGRQGQIWWTTYLMNYLSNLDETHWE